MTKKELITFCNELIEHLDYCGWGDRWERECSEDLRKRVQKFQQSLKQGETK